MELFTLGEFVALVCGFLLGVCLTGTALWWLCGRERT